MVRTYQEVSKRAKNSINTQIGKLVKKYGDKSVRLVATKFFDEISKRKRLEEDIEAKETELQELNRMKKGR